MLTKKIEPYSSNHREMLDGEKVGRVRTQS